MSLKEVARSYGHTAGVTTLAAGYNSRDALLLSGSDDRTCRIWDTRTNKSVGKISGFVDDVAAVDFVGENSIAVACGPTICIYDQRSVGINAQAPDTTAKIKQADNDSEIMAMSTRGDFIAYVDEDGHLSVCDVTDPENPARFTGAHEELASCVCFHPEEAIVATGGCDNQVRIWDIASEETVSIFKAHPVGDANRLVNPPFVYALDFAPYEDCTVVSGHADGRMMCSSDDGSFSWHECHGYSISAMQFVRSNPGILATAGLDCTLRLWKTDGALNSTKAPASLLRHSLTAKPDALVTSTNSPLLFIDQECAIVTLDLQ